MIDLSRCKKWTDKAPNRAKKRFCEIVQQLDPGVQREVQFHWLYSPKLAERSEREAVIAEALIEHCRRNRHLNLVKSRTDPDQIFADARCKGRARTLEFDFVLPQVGVAIEFDEKQHFTAERGVTLDFYKPNEFSFTKRWKDLCNPSIRDPDMKNPARDWQRAFKDAVRDLRSREECIPLLRIYYKDFRRERLEEPDVIERLSEDIRRAKEAVAA